MKLFTKDKKWKFLRRIVSWVVLASFSVQMTLPAPAYAQALLNLPTPGSMLGLSPQYTPALMTGLTIHPDNPLQFDFIIDTGDDRLRGEALQKESKKLVNYFMASLTVPEDEMWVNLSPHERHRIIADGLGKTEMGRDMLAQDYLLKQLAASLLHPEGKAGAEFWKRVRTKAKQKLGNTEIPTDLFNKVWIVPQDASVYVHENNVFVTESRLKVMLEQDYTALKNSTGAVPDPDKALSAESAQIIREVILPEIEKEVNEGKNFANLRQIYHSMILASWYKGKLRNSILEQAYLDKNKTGGIELEDTNVKEQIYNRYLEALKKGVYNFIKEDYDPVAEENVPRKYFSGGLRMATSIAERGRPSAEWMRRQSRRDFAMVAVNADVMGVADRAMAGAEEKDFQVLIRAATTQDELKRIYRKMAQTFHPDTVPAERKEESAEIFIRLADLIKKKLGSSFGVKPQYKQEDPASEREWFDTWSYTAFSNAGEAVKELKRRAAMIKRRGKEKIATVAAVVANNAGNLSLGELSALLDITSKAQFAERLLALTSKDAVSSQPLTNAMIWSARPMIEKIYAARTLRQGELVHFRKGTTIIRTAVLEPITSTNQSLRVITPTEGPYQIMDITIAQLIGPEYDLEREPVQQGFEINIGEIFEVDLSDDRRLDTDKATTIVTVYGVALGGFALVAQDVIHDQTELMGGHGYSLGKYQASEMLSAGKMRRITPQIESGFGLLDSPKPDRAMTGVRDFTKLRDDAGKRQPFLVTPLRTEGLPWENDSVYQRYLKTDPEDFFGSFDTDVASLRRVFPSRFSFLNQIAQGDRVLTLGFGRNFYAEAQALYEVTGSSEIIGVDWIAANLEAASQHLSDLAGRDDALSEGHPLAQAFRDGKVDVGFYQADLRNMEQIPDASVKFVFAKGVIMVGTIEPEKARLDFLKQLAEVKRVLKPEGVAVFVNSGIGSYGADGSHIVARLGVTAEDLNEIGMGFDLLTVGDRYGVLTFTRDRAMTGVLDQKVVDVKRRGGIGGQEITSESDIDRIVEEPWREAVKILYRKGLKTNYSSANVVNLPDGAVLGLVNYTVGKANRDILAGLDKELRQKNEGRIEFHASGSVTIFLNFNRDTTVQQLSDRAAALVSRLEDQPPAGVRAFDRAMTTPLEEDLQRMYPMMNLEEERDTPISREIADSVFEVFNAAVEAGLVQDQDDLNKAYHGHLLVPTFALAELLQDHVSRHQAYQAAAARTSKFTVLLHQHESLDVPFVIEDNRITRPDIPDLNDKVHVGSIYVQENPQGRYRLKDGRQAELLYIPVTVQGRPAEKLQPIIVFIQKQAQKADPGSIRLELAWTDGKVTEGSLVWNEGGEEKRTSLRANHKRAIRQQRRAGMHIDDEGPMTVRVGNVFDLGNAILDAPSSSDRAMTGDTIDSVVVELTPGVFLVPQVLIGAMARVAKSSIAFKDTMPPPSEMYARVRSILLAQFRATKDPEIRKLLTIIQQEQAMKKLSDVFSRVNEGVVFLPSENVFESPQKAVEAMHSQAFYRAYHTLSEEENVFLNYAVSALGYLFPEIPPILQRYNETGEGGLGEFRALASPGPYMSPEDLDKIEWFLGKLREGESQLTVKQAKDMAAKLSARLRGALASYKEDELVFNIMLAIMEKLQPEVSAAADEFVRRFGEIYADRESDPAKAARFAAGMKMEAARAETLRNVIYTPSQERDSNILVQTEKKTLYGKFYLDQFPENLLYDVIRQAPELQEAEVQFYGVGDAGAFFNRKAGTDVEFTKNQKKSGAKNAFVAYRDGKYRRFNVDDAVKFAVDNQVKLKIGGYYYGLAPNEVVIFDAKKNEIARTQDQRFHRWISEAIHLLLKMSLESIVEGEQPVIDGQTPLFSVYTPQELTLTNVVMSRASGKVIAHRRGLIGERMPLAPGQQHVPSEFIRHMGGVAYRIAESIAQWTHAPITELPDWETVLKGDPFKGADRAMTGDEIAQQAIDHLNGLEITSPATGATHTVKAKLKRKDEVDAADDDYHYFIDISLDESEPITELVVVDKGATAWTERFASDRYPFVGSDQDNFAPDDSIEQPLFEAVLEAIPHATQFDVIIDVEDMPLRNLFKKQGASVTLKQGGMRVVEKDPADADDDEIPLGAVFAGIIPNLDLLSAKGFSISDVAGFSLEEEDDEGQGKHVKGMELLRKLLDRSSESEIDDFIIIKLRRSSDRAMTASDDNVITPFPNVITMRGIETPVTWKMFHPFIRDALKDNLKKIKQTLFGAQAKGKIQTRLDLDAVEDKHDGAVSSVYKMDVTGKQQGSYALKVPFRFTFSALGFGPIQEFTDTVSREYDITKKFWSEGRQRFLPKPVTRTKFLVKFPEGVSSEIPLAIYEWLEGSPQNPYRNLSIAFNKWFTYVGSDEVDVPGGDVGPLAREVAAAIAYHATDQDNGKLTVLSELILSMGHFMYRKLDDGTPDVKLVATHNIKKDVDVEKFVHDLITANVTLGKGMSPERLWDTETALDGLVKGLEYRAVDLGKTEQDGRNQAVQWILQFRTSPLGAEYEADVDAFLAKLAEQSGDAAMNAGDTNEEQIMQNWFDVLDTLGPAYPSRERAAEYMRFLLRNFDVPRDPQGIREFVERLRPAFNGTDYSDVDVPVWFAWYVARSHGSILRRFMALVQEQGQPAIDRQEKLLKQRAEFYKIYSGLDKPTQDMVIQRDYDGTTGFDFLFDYAHVLKDDDQARLAEQYLGRFREEFSDAAMTGEQYVDPNDLKLQEVHTNAAGQKIFTRGHRHLAPMVHGQLNKALEGFSGAMNRSDTTRAKSFLETIRKIIASEAELLRETREELSELRDAVSKQGIKVIAVEQDPDTVKQMKSSMADIQRVLRAQVKQTFSGDVKKLVDDILLLNYGAEGVLYVRQPSPKTGFDLVGVDVDTASRDMGDAVIQNLVLITQYVTAKRMDKVAILGKVNHIRTAIVTGTLSEIDDAKIDQWVGQFPDRKLRKLVRAWTVAMINTFKNVHARDGVIAANSLRHAEQIKGNALIVVGGRHIPGIKKYFEDLRAPDPAMTAGQTSGGQNIKQETARIMDLYKIGDSPQFRQAVKDLGKDPEDLIRRMKQYTEKYLREKIQGVVFSEIRPRSVQKRVFQHESLDFVVGFSYTATDRPTPIPKDYPPNDGLPESFRLAYERGGGIVADIFYIENARIKYVSPTGETKEVVVPYLLVQDEVSEFGPTMDGLGKEYSESSLRRMEDYWRQFIAIHERMFERGIMNWDIKIALNYGVTRNGRVVLLDTGGIQNTMQTPQFSWHVYTPNGVAAPDVKAELSKERMQGMWETDMSSAMRSTFVNSDLEQPLAAIVREFVSGDARPGDAAMTGEQYVDPNDLKLQEVHTNAAGQKIFTRGHRHLAPMVHDQLNKALENFSMAMDRSDITGARSSLESIRTIVASEGELLKEMKAELSELRGAVPRQSIKVIAVEQAPDTVKQMKSSMADIQRALRAQVKQIFSGDAKKLVDDILLLNYGAEGVLYARQNSPSKGFDLVGVDVVTGSKDMGDAMIQNLVLITRYVTAQGMDKASVLGRVNQIRTAIITGSLSEIDDAKIEQWVGQFADPELQKLVRAWIMVMINFFKNSNARDGVIAANSLRQAEQVQGNVLIVVGGRHVPGIKKYFEDLRAPDSAMTGEVLDDIKIRLGDFEKWSFRDLTDFMGLGTFRFFETRIAQYQKFPGNDFEESRDIPVFEITIPGVPDVVSIQRRPHQEDDADMIFIEKKQPGVEGVQFVRFDIPHGASPLDRQVFKERRDQADFVMQKLELFVEFGQLRDNIQTSQPVTFEQASAKWKEIEPRLIEVLTSPRFGALNSADYQAFGRALRDDWTNNGWDAAFGRLDQYLAALSVLPERKSEGLKNSRQRADWMTKADNDGRLLALWTRGVELAGHVRAYGPRVVINEAGQVEFLDNEELVNIAQEYIARLSVGLHEAQQQNRILAEAAYSDEPFSVTHQQMLLWGLLVMLDPMIYAFDSERGNHDPEIVDKANAYLQERWGDRYAMARYYLERILTGLTVDDARLEPVARDQDIDKLLVEAFNLFAGAAQPKDLRSPFAAFSTHRSMYTAISKLRAERNKAYPITDPVFMFAVSPATVNKFVRPDLRETFFPDTGALSGEGIFGYRLFANIPFKQRFPHLSARVSSVLSLYPRDYDRAMTGDQAPAFDRQEFLSRQGRDIVFTPSGSAEQLRLRIDKGNFDEENPRGHMIYATAARQDPAGFEYPVAFREGIIAGKGKVNPGWIVTLNYPEVWEEITRISVPGESILKTMNYFLGEIVQGDLRAQIQFLYGYFVRNKMESDAEIRRFFEGAPANLREMGLATALNEFMVSFMPVGAEADISIGNYSVRSQMYDGMPFQETFLGRMWTDVGFEVETQTSAQVKMRKVRNVAGKTQWADPGVLGPHAGEPSDPAMTAEQTPGGIDFNARNLKISEQGGADIRFNFDSLEGLQPGQINGIAPVIINITPVVNFPLLLGVNTTEEQDVPQLSYR